MTGGLTQLVAYGAQDVYLTGDPKMTFWKSNFTSYKNFALESIRQDILGHVGSNEDITITLKRSGDLVYNIMFAITFKRGPDGIDDPFPYYSAEQFIKNLELYIGGQKVFEFEHEWFRIQWELFYDVGQENAYRNMVNWANEPQGYTRTFYLPIPVWFNALDPGRALPLIALQYHDVQFKIKLNNLNNILGIDPSYTPTMVCFADYVFLDSDERMWFAQNPHQYIIQQVQTNQFPIKIDTQTRDYKFYLNFNHPVKALIWACTPGSTSHGQNTSERGEVDAETLGPIDAAKIVLNGVDRAQERRGSYYTRANPWATFDGNYMSSGLYAYGFGIQTNSIDPSGTLNFSRIDNAMLQVRTKAAVVTDITAAGNVTEDMTTVGANILNTLMVWAPNYNVFKIQSGMGGVMFSS